MQQTATEKTLRDSQIKSVNLSLSPRAIRVDSNTGRGQSSAADGSSMLLSNFNHNHSGAQTGKNYEPAAYSHSRFHTIDQARSPASLRIDNQFVGQPGNFKK